MAADLPGILIVDDNDDHRYTLQLLLESEGHTRISVATGGEEAIALLKREKFSLILLDMMMPGMTGDELARTLRQTEPTLKVLYLTGYSDRLFKEKTMLWADEAFLDKPCTVKGLREAVSLLITGKFEPPPTTT
jgi:CheY-like chemotaxis protein